MGAPSFLTYGKGDARYLQPKNATETLGTLIRQNALDAITSDPWRQLHMSALAPWQPSTVYVQGAMIVNGGNIYVCTTAGTSAASGGPTQVNNVLTTDGTAVWSYFRNNVVTSDPADIPTAWTTGTNYAAGARTISGANVYGCVVGGVAGVTAPTGTGNSISDGTDTWTYMGPYVATPYTATFPTITVGASLPGGLTNTYIPTVSTGSGAKNAWPVTGGTSGYAVGDTITLTGGTFSTAVVLTVTSVSSGVVTGVNVTTPGSYTVLPGDPVSQGTTSGSGVGTPTFTVQWPDPGFCATRGCFNAGASGSPQCRAYVFQTATNFAFDTDFISFKAVEFWTDAPKMFIEYGASAGKGIKILISEAGGPFIPYNLAPLTWAAATTYVTIDFSLTSGRSKRLIRIENSLGEFNIPTIGVDTNSIVWQPDSTNRIRATAISDSIWAGSSSIFPYVPGNSPSLRLGHRLGWDVTCMAETSTGYVNPASGVGVSTNVFGFRIPQLLQSNPQVVIFMGSTNDTGYWVPSAATGNAVSPIVLTMPAASVATVTTGDSMTFAGALGNTAINGTWVVTVADSTHVSLNGSTGNGTYTASSASGVDTTAVTAAALAAFKATRAGFAGPIIVFGLWSVSTLNVLVGEQAIQAAVAAMNDPLVFFIPIDQDPYLPWITGSWNNNPAPSGITNIHATNSGLYINTSDNVHPLDIGAEYLAYRLDSAIREYVLPYIN